MHDGRAFLSAVVELLVLTCHRGVGGDGGGEYRSVLKQ